MADTSGVASDDPLPVVRQTTLALRGLLLIAAGLVALAGVQLFVFSHRTDRYFSWTIRTPLTAAFLGAGYWASVALEWISGRERVWAKCRSGVMGVFVFTTATLVATLLHLDLFHFGSEFSLATQLATWAWLAVYVIVPVVFLVVLADQLRQPGGDPPRTFLLPFWMQLASSIQAGVMLALGAALFVVPTRAAPWWPWPLTELTGRAVGAWLVGLAVVAAQLVRENDFTRLESVFVSNVVLSVLQLIALARYADSVDWSPEGSLYLLFLLSLLVVGVYGTAQVLLIRRRSRCGAGQSLPRA